MSHKMYVGSPASKHLSIAKSDSTTYGSLDEGDTYDRPDFVLVGTPGTVTIVDADGTSIQYTTAAANEILPIRPYKVMSTGTTASGIVGLYN